MYKIFELQKYRDAVGEAAAIHDFQLLISMRNGEFKLGSLVLEILSVYKELAISRDGLEYWEFPKETENYTIEQLIEHLSKE